MYYWMIKYQNVTSSPWLTSAAVSPGVSIQLCCSLAVIEILCPGILHLTRSPDCSPVLGPRVAVSVSAVTCCSPRSKSFWLGDSPGGTFVLEVYWNWTHAGRFALAMYSTLSTEILVLVDYNFYWVLWHRWGLAGLRRCWCRNQAALSDLHRLVCSPPSVNIQQYKGLISSIIIITTL